MFLTILCSFASYDLARPQCPACGNSVKTICGASPELPRSICRFIRKHCHMWFLHFPRSILVSICGISTRGYIFPRFLYVKWRYFYVSIRIWKGVGGTRVVAHKNWYTNAMLAESYHVGTWPQPTGWLSPTIAAVTHTGLCSVLLGTTVQKSAQWTGMEFDLAGAVSHNGHIDWIYGQMGRSSIGKVHTRLFSETFKSWGKFLTEGMNEGGDPSGQVWLNWCYFHDRPYIVTIWPGSRRGMMKQLSLKVKISVLGAA